MKAHVEIKSITPDYARALLANQIGEQRNLRVRASKEYARDMIKGDWHLSPDAIVVLNGKLANGQHRLNAVIEANRTVEFIVMYSDDPDLFKVIDCGLRRLASDAFKNIEYANKITGAASWIISYYKKSINPNARARMTPTRIEQIQAVEKMHSALHDCAKIVCPLYEKTRILAPTLGIASLYIMRQKHGIVADEFIKSIYNGATLDSCAFVLRERLLRIKADRNRSYMNPSFTMALVFKAFRAQIYGLSIGTLKIGATEAFPYLD